MADGPAAGEAAVGEAAAPATVLQGGRAKAYRPLPVSDREAAYRDGLSAYDRGDFFLAHELLEPAWMGTADIGERELYQGLIKLAAAYVHDVRGNPLGTAKNLEGARARLAAARDEGFDGGLDLEDLIARIGERLAIGADASGLAADPPIVRRKSR
jgi:predicted metal-dependent hydrolase